MLATGQKDARNASSGVQLAEVVGSIALAADLGLGQPLDHVLRSCVVATRFAEHLGVSREDRDATYWTTLFMTAGLHRQLIRAVAGLRRRHRFSSRDLLGPADNSQYAALHARPRRQW